MITLIICTYNSGTGSRQDGKSNLEECFKSLEPSLPTIVVNDGSKDNTADFIPRSALVIEHAGNEGLRDSFTEAIACVETPYFLRVDDDITFPVGTDWLAQIVNHFEQHPECGAVGATQLLHTGRLWCAGEQLLPLYKHLQTPIKGKYRICHSIMGCFSAFRKSSWPGLTCPKWMRAETEDVNIRIQQAGYEVHCLPLEFKHWHGFTSRKKGTYNDAHKAERIRAYMQQTYNYPFYEASTNCLPWLQEIRDV